ncbi:MAG TPA: DUF3604 domain-containing protein, partial [Acidobacteriota bacterium]
MKRILIMIAVMIAATLTVVAQEEHPSKADVEKITKPNYSPYAGREYPTRVFWGDTHLHTAISVDAGAASCTLGPEDAYRFARGEEVVTSTGQRAKLSRPLDFLVVSDHSEMYGLMPQLLKGDPAILATPKGKEWFDLIRQGGDAAFKAITEIVQAPSQNDPPIDNPQAILSAWQLNNAAAEKYNEPGRFT